MKVTQGLVLEQRQMHRDHHPAPREHMMYSVRMAARVVTSRLLCRGGLDSQGNSVKHFAPKPRTVLFAPCFLRGTGTLFPPNFSVVSLFIELDHGVVGFTFNDVTKDGEL